MPCDTQVRTTVDFGGAGVDLAAVAKALEGFGYKVEVAAGRLDFFGRGVQGSLVGGKLSTVGSSTFDLNALKVAYAGQVVRAAATRYGWKVQEQEAAVARLW